MRDFSGSQINKSIFTDLCGVSQGKFSPYIQPEEAAGVKYSCRNRLRQNIVTCKDESIETFINEVKGLEFNVSLKTRLKNLPQYIPIIDFRTLKRINFPDSIEYIGISLVDIIKSGFSFKAGRIHESNKINYRNILCENNLKSKKIILFLTGSDTHIEGVWYKRETSGLLDSIKSMNFYAVTAFNFSVFGEECAFSQILNLKRSLYSAHLLEEKKIRSIPHVYALNQFQVKRWIDFFKANPKIEYITMNCQFQKAKKNNGDLIETIKFILSEIPYLHIILQGFPLYQSENFSYFLNRIHFAEKKATKCAWGFKQMEFNGSSKGLLTVQRSKDLKRMDPLDLIIHNVIARQKYLESISKRVLYQLTNNKAAL